MKKNLNSLFKLGILLAFFIIFYWPTINDLVQKWLSSGDYSHCILIPFISFYFVWTQRDKLKNVTITPHVGGLFLLIFAAIALIIGEFADVTTTRISLWLAIVALVISNLGLSVTKTLSLLWLSF